MSECLNVYGREIPVYPHRQGKYFYWRAVIRNGGKKPEEYQEHTLEELQKRLEKELPCKCPAAQPAAYKISFMDWVWKWYEINKGAMSPSTQTTYYAVIRSMGKHYENFSVGSLRHEDAQRITINLCRQGIGQSQIKHFNLAGKQAMEMAILYQYILFNPFKNIRMPMQSTAERLPLSHVEFETFLEAIELSPRRNALAVMAFAGLRLGECRGLCWSDINFQSGTITVRRQRQRVRCEDGRYRDILLEKTKNGRDQTIYPPREVFKFLEDERVKQNYYKMIKGKGWKAERDYVFTTIGGDCICVESIAAAMNDVALQLNRPELTPHYLRHTAGTMMYELSGDLRATQDFLRHANIKTTVGYVHTSMESKRRAMEQYDHFINERKSGEKLELFDN